jgi:hypothetical protein
LGGEVRKTFAARADLLEKLSELAERRGLTLYALVNQLFQLEIEVGVWGVGCISSVFPLLALMRSYAPIAWSDSGGVRAVHPDAL